MKCKLRLFSVLLVLLALPTAALAQGEDPRVEVDTEEIFGNVEVGSSSLGVITIQNVGFYEGITIYSVSIQPDNSGFSITWESTGTRIGLGESEGVEVTFSPIGEGPATATLTIAWTDTISGSNTVALEGFGVGVSQDPSTVRNILDFFDESVRDGLLFGYGPGNSADGRRQALRNKIKAAGDLIDAGAMEDACQQLADAYGRCDGLPRPPEFVAGPATQTLAEMILTLMGELGCE